MANKKGQGNFNMPPGPGRNAKSIDKTQFETLCMVHATITEVCGVLNVDDMTLNAWCRRNYGTVFSEAKKKFEGRTQVSARRKLIEHWQNGNLDALKTYLKHHCGMNDKIDVNHEFDQKRPMALKVVWQNKEGETETPPVDETFYNKPAK